MSGDRIEWRRRVAFAEVAEALDISTDQIMAVQKQTGDDELLVLYTQAIDDPPTVYAVRLLRGADGVLFAASPSGVIPGLWDEIVRKMEGR